MSCSTADAATGRARSTYAAVARKLVILSRLAVRGHEVAPGQRGHRLARREPRGQADHAHDLGVVGDVDRGAGAHRVPEEYDGHVAVVAAYLLERPAGVLDRPGPAVPAPVAVAQQPGPDAGRRAGRA